MDKKSNYVKRCVGTPGDSLEIIAGIVHINGEELILSDRAKSMYLHNIYISTKRAPLNKITALDAEILDVTKPKEILVNCTLETAKKIERLKGIDSIVRVSFPKGHGGNIFPQHQKYNSWTVDNFGPIYIPQAGKTVALDETTLPFYKKIIRDYEKNDLEINNGSIFINNEKVTSYTFKQDYYWMMGDNRHNSEDSRAWGYVPADHIVGKPVFIWMSFDDFNDGIKLSKIRWERVFTTVGGDGEPKSYLKYFLIFLVLYFIGKFIYDKRKKSKSVLQ